LYHIDEMFIIEEKTINLQNILQQRQAAGKNNNNAFDSTLKTRGKNN